MINDTFYPTPRPLIEKMVGKITRKSGLMILEPSAGKGDIVEYLQNNWDYRGIQIDAIEIDETLRATLWGKYINVVDSDFLNFVGLDKYDVIIANPPFDEGDKHLLKAIEIMYCGEIIFLLNAETIKNPYTNTRKELVKQLNKLGAEIEYIQNGFMDAEKKTGVEVALVYIKIVKSVEEDLFEGANDKAKDTQETIETPYEIATLNNIQNMVDDFNRVVSVGSETLINYYKNYKHISKFIKLASKDGKCQEYYNDETLTQIMQDKLNVFLREVRKSYWEEVLNLDVIKNRLTRAKRDIFYHQLKARSYMDFTENNIRTFVLNIINGFGKTLTEAVVELFDMMTIKHSWDKNKLYEENIHYFNGWQTNKAFYVNQKVILPYFYFWDNIFNKWRMGYDTERKLSDIDVVMNYFDGMNNRYLSIAQALRGAFDRGQTKKVLSTYFEITVYKKGTIHLVFRNEGMRRRFNITACKGKHWLPADYGVKPFEQLPAPEQEIVMSFEGKETYDKNVGDCFYIPTIESNLLTI
ncbi:MAG: DUF4942 domain-containing protein [Thermodesulfobacteriota bacterium]